MSEFSSADYWERRYLKGETSGEGSYNKSAKVKAEYINAVVKRHNIESVNDFGHGDGNQLFYIKGFDSYTGYDVSSAARKKCMERFTDRDKYTFIDSPSDFEVADLAISLDVIYHLVEDDVYHDYLKTLFSIGDIILIYSTNKEVRGTNRHVRHRNITSYINDHFPDFKLEDTTPVLKDHILMHLYTKK